MMSDHITYCQLMCEAEGLETPRLRIAAMDGSEMVGFIAVDLVTESAWISEVFVRDDYRRIGIGKSLVGLLLDSSEVKDRSRVIACGIVPTNEASTRLFLSCGFRYAYQYNDEKKLQLYSRSLHGD